ncbi:hypothetical protein LWI29_035330 [Acer saccharum]|uniref:Cupin type-1 domain-containing protein n=1 Tax=Acer saccharum TaxID=4024 RepID=A0AA39W513_ACESA|nr:hypothetical protein LWI29_035330 [Acer saccharum]
MKAFHFLVASVFLALASSLASASDPSPLQDFCVAINDTKNGGLNTLGISLARIDYAPYGQNPPHTHPRASEILFVQEGTLYVGFVTSNPDNKLFTKVLHKGDVFVFPVGLIHFQFNIGKTNAVAFAALSSQNPGVITIANAVFKSDPPINPDVLAKAFQLDQNVACPKKIKIFINGEAKIVSLVEDPSPIPLSWIEEVLEIRSSVTNLPDAVGSTYGFGRQIGKVPSKIEAHEVGGSKYGSKAGNKVEDTPKPTNQTPLGCKRKVDKGKGSWIKKARAKPIVTYNTSARIDLDKRLADASGVEISNSGFSSSSDSSSLLWKGECSKRGVSNGPQSPSLDLVLKAHSGNISNGQDYKSSNSSPMVAQRIIKAAEGHADSESEEEGEGLDNSEQESEDSSFEGDEEGSLPVVSGNKEGTMFPLGENVLEELGEINLSVVLPTPPPNLRSEKSKVSMSKLHGMRTRRDNRRDPISTEKRQAENKQEAQGCSEDTDRGVDSKYKSKAISKTRLGSRKIEAEIATVIETGKAVGFDFMGREQEVTEQLLRREWEDEERLKEIRR